MSKDLKLDKLLEDGPLLLILGAGSSADYGFPLWKELKNDIQVEITKGIEENKYPKSLNKFLSELEKQETTESKKNTLDQLLHESKSYLEKDYKIILKILAKIILNYEQNSLRLPTEEYWINSFIKKIIKEDFFDQKSQEALCKTWFTGWRKNLNKINIINFNYDRVFEYNIIKSINSLCNEYVSYEDFIDKFLENSITEGEETFQVPIVKNWRPHGAIARLPIENRTLNIASYETNSYRDKNTHNILKFGASLTADDLSTISWYMVDELEEECKVYDYAYSKLNSFINNQHREYTDRDLPKNIIFIGMSDLGICKSHLELHNIPDNCKVYLTNPSDPQDPELRKQVLIRFNNKTVTFLGKGSSSLHCKDLVELL